MAKAPEIDIEQMFAPQAELSAYETMDCRDIYLALVKGALTRHGLPTDEENLTPLARDEHHHLGTHRKSLLREDPIVIPQGNSEREITMQTMAIIGSWEGVPDPKILATRVLLSTILANNNVAQLETHTFQEHEDLFLSASLNARDSSRNDRRIQNEKRLVAPVWAGNVSKTSEPSSHARERYPDSTFRDITPTKKRVPGIVIGNLSQLAIARA